MIWLDPIEFRQLVLSHFVRAQTDSSTSLFYCQIAQRFGSTKQQPLSHMSKLSFSILSPTAWSTTKFVGDKANNLCESHHATAAPSTYVGDVGVEASRNVHFTGGQKKQFLFISRLRCSDHHISRPKWQISQLGQLDGRKCDRLFNVLFELEKSSKVAVAACVESRGQRQHVRVQLLTALVEVFLEREGHPRFGRESGHVPKPGSHLAIEVIEVTVSLCKAPLLAAIAHIQREEDHLL